MRAGQTLLTIGIGLALTASAQSQDRASEMPIESPGSRSLGAHVHGTGQINIAIERGSIEMELEVPAMDIVGFEHGASTAEQQKALANARTLLAKPLGLMKFPDAAGCKVKSAKTRLEGGGAHEHTHAKKGTDSVSPPARDKAESGHAEFHAEYTMTCAKPELILSIDFDYFKVFPRAETLDVTVIGPKGQAKAKATRERPRVELKGHT